MPTIKASDLPKHIAARFGRRRNKYNVAPVDQRRARGRTYASKAEKEYADMLWSSYNGGTIRVLIEQPRLWLGVPENVYVPDFFMLREDGTERFIDVKGSTTAAFKRNVKLWRQYGMCDLLIVTRKGRTWHSETITPEARR